MMSSVSRIPGVVIEFNVFRRLNLLVFNFEYFTFVIVIIIIFLSQRLILLLLFDRQLITYNFAVRNSASAKKDFPVNPL